MYNSILQFIENDIKEIENILHNKSSKKVEKLTTLVYSF